MNYVMYILVNKDLKGKMTAQKLAGQVAHAAGTYMYRHAMEEKTACYMFNNQTKIILECPEKKLLEYEKDLKMIPVRDAGHTELEPGTLTCICAGIFDKEKDEIPKDIKKMQLLHWETVLNYDKYYTGREILELIAKDRIPENHLIKAHYKDKRPFTSVPFLIRNRFVEFVDKNEESVCIDYLSQDDDCLYKIDKEEYIK